MHTVLCVYAQAHSCWHRRCRFAILPRVFSCIFAGRFMEYCKEGWCGGGIPNPFWRVPRDGIPFFFSFSGRTTKKRKEKTRRLQSSKATNGLVVDTVRNEGGKQRESSNHPSYIVLYCIRTYNNTLSERARRRRVHG